MLGTLKQPKWIVATLVVIALATIFIRLGFWQLDRHQDRIEENALRAERYALPAQPLTDLLVLAGDDLASIEYRRALVDGAFVPSEEVLIRSQVHLGTAGFHVITPYGYKEDTVLVNRGWVPLTMDSVPVDALPDKGPIEGWVHLSQERGWLSPADPTESSSIFNRVDIARIQQEVPAELDAVYLVQVVADEGQLPSPVDTPDFSDQGSHLAYTIQWFGFAAVGLVGFFFLIRRKGSLNP